MVADMNEPAFDWGAPARSSIPAQELCCASIKNADTARRSFHLQGLSVELTPTAWLFGAQSADEHRSDEICPGQTWTTPNVTGEMMDAWPFYDHYRDIEASVNRGLLGGLMALPRRRV
jgi:hypothetical protein